MCYNQLRHCPGVLMVLVFAGSLAAFLLAIHLYSMPTFDDPLLGFEVRHTELSNRINTWRLLTESTAWNGPLSLSPKREAVSTTSTTPSTTTTTTTATTTTTETPRSSRRKGNKKGKKKNKKNKKGKGKGKGPDEDLFNSRAHQESKGMFCGAILPDYVHVIVQRNDGGNLFELETLKNLCQLDRIYLRQESIELRAYDNQSLFANFCEIQSDGKCCASWSLPNYILSVGNKSDCDMLVESDLDNFLHRLSTCADHFASQNLNERCEQAAEECPNVQSECFLPDNFVFNIFSYLVDYRFMDVDKVIYNLTTNVAEVPKGVRPMLRSTSIYLPMAKSTKLLSYFETLTETHLKAKLDVSLASSKAPSLSYLSLNNVRLVAADLGVKHTLFSRKLVIDLMWNVLSGVIILILLYLYTQSVVLTVVALVANVLSLGTAYFLYKVVFGIEFFPFLNLLTLAILIGIGSDNVLIYCKAWTCCFEEIAHERQVYDDANFYSSNMKIHKKSQRKSLNRAFRHVFTSSLCASLTTGCAFFVGYFADITSLKCFAIFAGTTILTNFALTVATFPSALILSDNLSRALPSWFQCASVSQHLSSLSAMVSTFLFERILLKLIVFTWARYVVIVVFLLTAIVSGFVVFHRPGLRLPEAQDFQVFTADHIFEAYDLRYQNEFWSNRYDRSMTKTEQDVQQFYGMVFPVRIVFGLHPTDTGNQLNPFDRGKLVFDPDFNITTKRAQSWMLNFCHKLIVQPFVRQMIGPMLGNCFISSFQSWMKDRPCHSPGNIGDDGDGEENHRPCCERQDFPYHPSVFSKCLPIYIDRLQKTPQTLVSMSRAGPRFESSGDGQVKVVVIEYDSTFDVYNNSFAEMRKLWTRMNAFVEKQIKKAPPELRSGFLTTSNLEFYSLQESLQANATKSIEAQIVCVFLILLLITWNIRLSLLSIVSISSTIVSTLAILILLGWRLNIIESITISLAIGLAIDSTLHYTIAYKLLSKGNHLLGIQRTVARIASPVAMGALTTFVAGLGMMPSSIEAYQLIGTFLIVLSTCSWFYSTLFHLCLLAICGEANGNTADWILGKCTQCLCKCCCCQSDIAPIDATGDGNNYDHNDNAHNIFIDVAVHQMKPEYQEPVELAASPARSRYDGRNQRWTPRPIMPPASGARVRPYSLDIESDYATFMLKRPSTCCLHVTSL